MAQKIGLNLVRFNDAKTEFRGFKEIMRTGQGIRHIEGRKYVITTAQCKLLKARKIAYKVQKRL